MNQGIAHNRPNGQPTVWAVVLNWNRPKDTYACVESLRKSDYYSLNIIVVDNGSNEENYKELTRSVSGVHFIRSDVNLGFARGNNLGIQYALENDADYILILNNDTIIDSQMVTKIVEAMETDPKIGIAGPVIYYINDKDAVWFAGQRFKPPLYVVRRGLHLKQPMRPVEDVDFVSGCGMMLRRETIERVGIFSSDYFMYYEDLDLCLRAKKAGYRIICVTGAKMWHAVSASSGGSDSPIKQYHQVRSSLIFYRRHVRGAALVVNISLRLLHAALSVIKHFLVRGINRALLRYYLQGLREGVRD